MSLIIGITCFSAERQHRLNSAYVNSLLRQGVTPVVLPYLKLDNREAVNQADLMNLYKEHFSRIAEKMDGLLLTGGADINPLSIGENMYASSSCDEVRDMMEIGYFQSFYNLNKPIMGICRGHQLIGNLMMEHPNFQQDLNPNDTGEIHAGNSIDLKNRQEACHVVEIYDSLSDFYSEKKQMLVSQLNVNSWHHQGFTLSPNGEMPSEKQLNKMTFPRFRENLIKMYEIKNDVKILACTNLVIEALEYKSKIYSVQWHPEEYGNESLAIGYWLEKVFNK